MFLKRCFALVLAVGSFAMVAAAPAVTLRTIPTISCITPEKTTYEKRVNASGTIEAVDSREVYLDTPVIAESVNVTVGDTVKRDQVLAVINTELTKSVLSQSIPASSLVGNLPTDQQAADLMGLYSALQSSGLVGSSDLQALAQTYGAVDSIPEANSYLYVPETVTAPMEGVVTAVGIKSNVLSRTAQPVVTISDPDSFVAMVTVGESYISDIKVGDQAVLQGAGFGREYTGHVSKIYPVAHKLAGGTTQETVVDLEIAIDNPDSDLKAGFTTRAEIITNTQREMLTVPYEAVRQDENNVEYVYVFENSKAVRRDIKTGMELLEGVEIASGLSEDDVVLSDASRADKAGARIQLKRG